MLSGYQTENAFDLQAAPGAISSERCMRLIERAVVLAEVAPQQNVLCYFRGPNSKGPPRCRGGPFLRKACP